MRRPGGELATRPLHFIWLADCSGSMGSDGKIQALNTAIREAVPHMQRVADENPNAHVLVRAVKFASLVTYFGHVDPHLYGIDYSFPPTTPSAGRCAVSANFLAGYPYGITYAGERVLGVRPGAWSWFDRFRPVARVGRSIYVFDVKPGDLR